MQGIIFRIIQASLPAIISGIVSYWNKIQNDAVRAAEFRELVSIFVRAHTELAERVDDVAAAEKINEEKRAEYLRASKPT